MKNIGQMMKQAQQMQAKMAEMQEQLANIEVTGASGGGMIQVTLSLRYGTDNAPVEDAGVVVNGAPCTYQGGGVYTTSLTSLQPMTSLQSLIQVDGKVVEQLTVTAPMVGNIAVMVAVLALVVLAVNRLRR